MNLKTNIITILLALTCTFSFAQRKAPKKYKKKSNSHRRGAHKVPVNYINNIQGTFFLGLANYEGDIALRPDVWKQINPSLGVGGQYRFNQNISFKGELNFVRVNGSDEFSSSASLVPRNLSFATNIYEFNVGATYDLFKFNKMYRRRKKFTPYGTVGFGVFHFNPTTKLEGKKYKLRDFQTEGKKYSSINFSAQLGAGIRMKVTPRIDVSGEMIYRKTFTDYIDDVSTIYPTEIASWEPTRQALSSRNENRSFDEVAGGIRGNPDNKDSYVTIGFKVAYTLKVTQQRYNLKRNSSKLRMHKGINKKK